MIKEFIKLLFSKKHFFSHKCYLGNDEKVYARAYECKKCHKIVMVHVTEEYEFQIPIFEEYGCKG